MKLYYENSIGQVIDLMAWPYRISDANLRDYQWNYESRNSINPKIARFYRDVCEKTMIVDVSSKTLPEYNRWLTYLLEVTERDILDVRPGRLFIDEDYLRCYFVKSEKTSWIPGLPYIRNQFTLVSENGAWIRETTTTFAKRGIVAYKESENPYLDYPYDFKYDYTGNKNATVKNSGYAEAEFLMTICGPCQNPSVLIANHNYQVNVELEYGEFLKIDSRKKRIYKVLVNGEEVNQFHLRNRESYVFEKIPRGESSVVWDGAYYFYLTLYEERSEPRWI